MVDKIMNVQLGSKAGDGELVSFASSLRTTIDQLLIKTLFAAFAGLSILMPMLVSHEGGHKPSWSYDISILTDGESFSSLFLLLRVLSDCWTPFLCSCLQERALSTSMTSTSSQIS